MKTRATGKRISRPDQIRVLASPLRQEIADTLGAAGPSSAAELAELLGRPADSLYYHLRLLRDAELIREGSREMENGRTESVYSIPTRRLLLRHQKGNAEAVDAITKAFSSALRLADRDFTAALQEGRAVFQGAKRNAAGGRVTGWLEADELAELHEHLDRIKELMERSKRTRKGKLYAITFLTNPLPAQPARRDRNGSPS